MNDIAVGGLRAIKGKKSWEEITFLDLHRECLVVDSHTGRPTCSRTGEVSVLPTSLPSLKSSKVARSKSNENI